jgi:hypothetical protein
VPTAILYKTLREDEKRTMAKKQNYCHLFALMGI